LFGEESFLSNDLKDPFSELDRYLDNL